MESLRQIIDAQIDLAGLTANYFRSELKIPDGQAVDSHVSFKGKNYLQLTGQDYLSLTNDPRLISSATAAIEKYGIGALGSPLVTGTLDIHVELQMALSRFMNTEGAVVFTTGMLTNLGCISAIINSPYRLVMRGLRPKGKRVIFADDRCHESLRMACDLCAAHGVMVHKYLHLDHEDLRTKIMDLGGDSNLILTDGVFSMDGDIAPLPEIVQIADENSNDNRHTAIYVDDAHGIGILGDNGRGVCELLKVEGQVITMGVLSKAFGALGGFVAGPKWLTDYLAYSNTHMFSLSLPPGETAATITAIEILTKETDRRRSLLENVEFLRAGLKGAGFEVLGDHTQIVFVVIGNEGKSARLSALLEENGILCPEIKFPAVGMGRAGIRLSPCFNHTRDDIEYFLDTFIRVAS